MTESVVSSQVKRRIEKAPQELVDLKNELALWDQQLNTLKRLIPVEVNYNKLIKDEIPAAEQAVQVQEDKLAPAKLKAEEVSCETFLRFPISFADDSTIAGLNCSQ